MGHDDLISTISLAQIMMISSKETVVQISKQEVEMPSMELRSKLLAWFRQWYIYRKSKWYDFIDGERGSDKVDYSNLTKVE